MAGARFLSGWQTAHPLVDRYLSPAGDEATLSDRYSFLSDSAVLSDAIRTFHLNVDGVTRSSESIFVAPGSSPLLMALFLALPELPEEHRELIRYACSNLTGATGSASEPYALHLMSILNSPAGDGDLVAHIRSVHSKLVEDGVLVAEAANPVASYYTFAKLPGELLDNAIVMDQRFFGIEGFDGYVRVNLLCGEWPRRYPGISGHVQ